MTSARPAPRDRYLWQACSDTRLQGPRICTFFAALMQSLGAVIDIGKDTGVSGTLGANLNIIRRSGHVQLVLDQFGDHCLKQSGSRATVVNDNE